MPADPLREKLKALVEEWRDWCERMPALYSERLTREVDADQLAALLAESEPKPVLKLGHEFMAAIDSLGRASKSSADFCCVCGQPREAH